MSSQLLSQVDNLASLAGIIGDWDLQDGSYTNPNGNITYFTIVNPIGALIPGATQIPIESYVGGVVSTYNLINGANQNTNQGLFNTTLATNNIREKIVRKHTINRVPLANYDQPVDLGIGGQHIHFKVLITGTQYLKAYYSIVQCLFDNKVSGLGVLVHPIYGTIQQVLPVEMGILFEYGKLNTVICELVFKTSNINHLNPQNITNSTLSTIGTYFAGTQNAITTLQATSTTAKSLAQGITAI